MTHLLDAVVADTISDTLNVQPERRRSLRHVRVVATGTVSVKLQGRMDSNDTWFDIGSAFTATGFVTVMLPPQVRINADITGVAEVSAWVDA